MNPIKNKKDLETTIDEIRNLAHNYLEKYSPSKQELRTYLFKKILRKKQKISTKKELFNLIDVVVSTLEQQKFLNDKHFSINVNWVPRISFIKLASKLTTVVVGYVNLCLSKFTLMLYSQNKITTVNPVFG